MLRVTHTLLCLALVSPVHAQQIINHGIPVGKGSGTGFRAVGPCALNQAPVWSSATGDPACKAIIETVSSSRDYFVRTDGNDTNCSGLTNVADPGSGVLPRACAWRTIQKGMNYVCSNLFVNARVRLVLGVAGTYDAHTPCVYSGNTIGGTNSPVVVGDVVAQASYIITASSGSQSAVVAVDVPTPWAYQGVSFTTTGTGQHCINADINSFIYVDQVRIGPCISAGISAGFNGKVEAISYNGSGTGTKITFVGAIGNVYNMSFQGQFLIQPTNTIACSGLSFSNFLAGSNGSLTLFDGTTFSGCGGATGTKFVLDATAIASFNGSSAALLNTLPGSVNGAYIPIALERGGTAQNGGYSGHGDSSFNMTSAECPALQLTAVLTAPRTWSLPVSTTMNAGTRCTIFDPNVLTAANSLTINTQSESMFGVGVVSNSIKLNQPGASATFLTNASGLWYLVAYSGQYITTTSLADQSKSVQVPLTGFGITVANGVFTLILDPAGTLATGTITMPSAPTDGQWLRLKTSQTITALTLSPNAGQTMKGNPTTLALGGMIDCQYHLASTTWYC